MVIAVVGGSRATLGLFAIGLVLTLVFSLQHGTTPRKIAFGGAALLLLLCSTPVMVWALNHRSAESKESSDIERSAMKSAARMIIADHPFGVGANQYVLVANTGGYSQRAGVAWNYGSRSAPVHDTYYLVTAELGFMGLIGFLGTIVGFIALGWRTLRRRSEDESNELVPGLLATMIVVSVHVSYEWVFMNFIIHYMFAVAAGLLVGVVARSRSPLRLPPALMPVAAASPAV
jgi:O-antigen ligase